MTLTVSCVQQFDLKGVGATYNFCVSSDEIEVYYPLRIPVLISTVLGNVFSRNDEDLKATLNK